MPPHREPAFRTRFQTPWWQWTSRIVGAAMLATGLFATISLEADLALFCSGAIALMASRHMKPRSRSDRGEILILRLFSQDHVPVGSRVELEKLIVSVVRAYGDCVMVGRPGELLPDVDGARREYLGDDWLWHVTLMARHAHLVVVILGQEVERGRGIGLAEELVMLRDTRALPRCMFVVPPAASWKTRRRPKELYGNPIPNDANAIVATIDASWADDGSPTRLQPCWESELGGSDVTRYRRSIQSAYERIQSNLSRT